MQTPAAHDTYAKELWSLKHGHPLWSPEPSPAFGEVRLGDVGYLDEGRFCFLFNAMRPAGDPVNKRGVPENFQTFVPPDPNSIQYYPDKITQPELHSGSISSLSVSVGASLKELGASAEAALRYECKQTSGALLLLKENAHKTYLDCGNHIKRYMAAHIEHWYDFASECLGIDVQEQDILFVSGFTKTSVWAEAAFHSGSAQGELLVAAGCFAPAAGGEFRVTMSRARDASVASRIGPSQRVKKDYTPVDGAAASEAEFDQCIFLNYHKAKRRKAWRPLKVIRAAAGPHDLPRPPGSSGSGSSGFNSTLNSSTTTGELGSQHTFNPVNHLLDYTLDNSDAAVACVSDADLADLFQGRTLPDDLRGDLEFQSAPITVDGTGMGTVLSSASDCHAIEKLPTYEDCLFRFRVSTDCDSSRATSQTSSTSSSSATTEASSDSGSAEGYVGRLEYKPHSPPSSQAHVLKGLRSLIRGARTFWGKSRAGDAHE